MPYQDYWFLEDPVTKSLVQEVEISLEPSDHYTFIVVLRSPIKRYSALFATNAVITAEGVPDSLSVFCFGSMEIPRMVCPKEIKNEELGYSALKVIMKRAQPFAPVKVLLENKGDLPVECQFLAPDLGELGGNVVRFSLPRDKVSIEPKQRSLLDVKAHLSIDPKSDDGKPITVHKLLIGKVRECELRFRLIIEVLVI